MKRLSIKHLLQSKKFLVAGIAILILVGVYSALVVAYNLSKPDTSIEKSPPSTSSLHGNDSKGSSSQAQTASGSASTAQKPSNCGQIDASAITQYSNNTHITSLNTQQDYDAYNLKVATAYKTYKNEVVSKGCTPVLTQPKPFVYQPSTYTPPTPPSCDETKKADVVAVHDQQLVAEDAKHNVTQASINAMPAFTALEIANRYSAQTAENNRHSSAISGIESAYNLALAIINC